MNGAVDPVARARADEAHNKIEAHEDLCAERYKNIHERLSLVLRMLGWGGATLMTVIIALMGFLATRAINANDSEQAFLKAKVELLEQQVAKPPASQEPTAR